MKSVWPSLGAVARGSVMSDSTLIQWTNSTWNPVVGCTRVSPGCTNCYAIRDARRLGQNPNPKVNSVYGGLVSRTPGGGLDWSAVVRCVPERLGLPLKWSRPRRIFVNSQSDLFHQDVPQDFIQRVFEVIRRAHWHEFQVLTKRAERLEELAPHLEWPGNVWMGVSVENQDYAFRVDHLRRTPAKVR